jgi:hypothetical protein
VAVIQGSGCGESARFAAPAVKGQQGPGKAAGVQAGAFMVPDSLILAAVPGTLAAMIWWLLASSRGEAPD